MPEFGQQARPQRRASRARPETVERLGQPGVDPGDAHRFQGGAVLRTALAVQRRGVARPDLAQVPPR